MKVAILGWGVDTQDVEPYLRAQGHEIKILDEKEKPFGELEEYDMIVRSPGVYRYRKELKELKIPIITSKIKIFFDVCPGKIIGVTGTKGKGTTSTLIYEILKKAGKDVYLGGNIGKGIFNDLSLMTSESWVVLELSSFQLIDLHKSPHISVTLMTTLDHLDYHKDESEYVGAKTQISKFQGPNDFSIYNIDYPNSVKIGQQGIGKKIAVSKEDWTKPLRLRGNHNRENMAAAAAVAKELGISIQEIEEVAKEFKGLEHRLEEVATVNGVTYFDDSFSTVPETTIAAIKAFSEPMVLIAGGSEKGSDFTELGKTISASCNLKAVILIGLMADRIDKAILNRSLRILRNLSNMSEIVRAASEIAQSGDVVVMSPAAASFDMFKSYKDRGDQFKNYILSLRFPPTSKMPIKVPIGSYLKSLKNPGKIRRWAYEQPLVKNNLTDEPLVCLSDYGISNYSYEYEKHTNADSVRLLGHEVILTKEVYSRKTVAEILQQIDNNLKVYGLHLYIRSGYRSPEAQELAYLLAREKKGLTFAKSRYAIKSDLVGKDSVYPHSSGGAVDVELYYGNKRITVGEEGVPLGVWELEILFSEDPQVFELKSLMMNDLKLKNVPDSWRIYLEARRVLYHAMVNQNDLTERFIPITREFWHFARGDFLSGMVAKMFDVKYQPYYGLAKME